MKTRKNRLKGSVLFTVVSVMALLIIFLMSTLLLSTAASRRSHANYSQSQAEYTARAAIESFAQAMSQNAAVAESVATLQKSATLTPSVVINNAGMGEVGYYDSSNVWQKDKMIVEYVDDSYVFNSSTGKPEKQQLYRAVATAKVGKEERTISMYFRTKTPGTKSSSTSIKGFQTLGATIIPTGGTVTGALCVGINYPEGAYKDGNVVKDSNGNDITLENVVVENDPTFANEITFINGNLEQGGGNGISVVATGTETGTVVMGDLIIDNHLYITVDYPYAKMTEGIWKYEDITQQMIPYLYIDGTLRGKQATDFIEFNTGVDTLTEKKNGSPYNIFAGKVSLANQSFSLTGADLYLMDSTGTSYLTDNSHTAKLYAWSRSVANKTATQFYSTGGNIYCNHNLELGKGEYYGDIRVKGDLKITAKDKATFHIHGDLVVGGNIEFETGGAEVNLKADTLYQCVDGKIYVSNPDSYEGGDHAIRSDVYARNNNFNVGNVDYGYVKVQNVEINKNIHENYRTESKEVGNWAEFDNPFEGGKIFTKVTLVENAPFTPGEGESVTQAQYTIRYDYSWPPHYYIKEVGTDSEIEVDEETKNAFESAASWSNDLSANVATANVITRGSSTEIFFGNGIYVNANTGELVGSKYTYQIVYNGEVIDYSGAMNNLQLYRGFSDDREQTSGSHGANIDKIGGSYRDTQFVTRYVVSPSGAVYTDGDGNEVVTDSPYTYWVSDNLGNAVMDGDGHYNITALSTTAEWETEVPETLKDEYALFFECDAYGTKTENVTNQEFTYYYNNNADDPTQTPDWTKSDEGSATGGEGYYTAWYSSAVNTNGEAVYYYDADPSGKSYPADADWLKLKSQGGHRLTESEIYGTDSKVENLSVWLAKNSSIYPSSMTREAIKGETNDGKYKIIKTLEEVREAVGYTKAEGSDKYTLDSNTYYTDVPGGSYDAGTTNYKADFTKVTIKGQETLYINAVNGGTYNGEKIVITGNDNDTGETIFIDPQDKEMWVVLDNVTFGSSEAKIIVGNSGSVNFLIRGTVTFKNGGILTEDVYNKINSGAVIVVKEDDEYNINYYGVHDSVLMNLNQAMFCGSAKCPYTTLSWSNTTAATPGKFIYYDAKGNKTSHTQGVSWIGNCLFQDMNTGSNDFTLLFTKSGGGEGQDIKNALTNNMWTIMYYDVY